MARQRKKHHFWRNLLILIVLFGIYLYWGNRSIETDEATFTSGAVSYTHLTLPTKLEV